jgi:hypothetical protein
MRHLIFLSLIILIISTLLFSCKKDDTIDNEVQNSLSGTWRYEIGSITFTKNWEYIDSMYEVNYADSLIYVIKGNYNLKDDYIELRDLKYTYRADLSGTRSLHFLFPVYKFEIADNSLSMIETGIFNPIGHDGNAFGGIWESYRLIVVLDNTQTPVFLSGNQIMQLDISESTKEYTVTYKNEYGTMRDTLIDGPYMYSSINNDFYCENCLKPYATLTDGKLISKNGPITYTKMK